MMWTTLDFDARIDAPHLRRLQRAAEEDAELEEGPLRAHEKVTGLSREHDRLVRRIDPLIAESDGRFAQPLPGVSQVLGEILGERRFGRRPAVVLLAFVNPLLAVVALPAGHAPIVTGGRRGPLDRRRPGGYLKLLSSADGP